MEPALLQSILIAASIGIASGTVGTFIILERMALTGDALAHVALPGIALALAYGFDPFWGVIAFLLCAAFLMWWLKAKTSLPADALVGILFTTILAVGILTIPDHEMMESLFGAFPALSPTALAAIVIWSAFITFVIFKFAKRFLFMILSPEVAKVHGIGSYYELLLLLIFAVVVSLGIKLVGTLLMGALTIIPALVARNLARSMRGYLVFSACLGGMISVAGVILAGRFHFLPGPTIVLFGVGCFIVSLLFSKKNS